MGTPGICTFGDELFIALCDVSLTFTATPFAVVITIEGQGDDTVEAGGVTDISISGFYIKPRYIRDGGDQGNSGMAFQWMAIGRWK